MKRRFGVLLTAWLVLLAASHAVRRGGPGDAPDPAPPSSFIELPAVDAENGRGAPVRMVYRDVGSRRSDAVLLLHGSPGSKADFRNVEPRLSGDYRVITPDLPGFGESDKRVPHYSVRAHARYALDLIERLGIDSVHVVGFSMGGGVGLELYRQAPERVRSLTLLSAIGVQELELFGDYRMNHVVHGVQLAGILLVEEAVPHFGALDDLFFGSPYAWNFYDTDQRPLRDVLRGFEPPMLIIHGEADPLIPAAAAREHARIVPQSELLMLADDHFMVFRDNPTIAERLRDFFDRVDAGVAPSRGEASAERLRASEAAFDPADIPPAHGIALVLLFGATILATLVLEDLTCIIVGLMIAQGRMPLMAGIAACFLGIFVGDMLLFAAGRWLGRPAIARAPLKWFIHPEQVEVASRWFNRRGSIVILISRFVPGMRLPTYFAAGLLRTSSLRFAAFFAVAIALWVPILVIFSSWIGDRVIGYFDYFERHLLTALVLIGLWILVTLKLIVPLFTWRGRRRLAGTWRRWTNWEFWPPWLFYPPVVVYIAWLGLRYRSPFLFTAVNPSIEASGFISESKHAILEGLRDSPRYVAAYALLPARETVEQRLARVAAFQKARDLDYPLVLKPDAGQRGSGVTIARSDEQVWAYLENAQYDAIVQEFVPGHELGVFYIRHPGEKRGQIFSITEKKMPFVTGDGVRTLERLVYEDPRAVAMADLYLAGLGTRIADVPAAGELVQLVELGTHCRGAIFLDGKRFITEALTRRIDAISSGFEGFFFGRYDVRADDIERLAQGDGFKVLELNGVTSEATHIYDPKHSVFQAWGVLFRQWRKAFEIGHANRSAGHAPVGPSELLRLLRAYRRLSRSHPG